MDLVLHPYASAYEIYVDNVILGHVFPPALPFSPVSTIPPMLHTHSFTYHPRCIMFLSQYFSFPCQYHSTNTPYPFIHLPPTLYNIFLPVFLSSSVSIIPPVLHTHLRLSSIFSEGQAVISMRTVKERISVWDIGGTGYKRTSITFFQAICALMHIVLALEVLEKKHVSRHICTDGQQF